MGATIDQLIINSPWDEPEELDRERLQPERRHRVWTRQDAAGRRAGRWRAGGVELPVEALEVVAFAEAATSG